MGAGHQARWKSVGALACALACGACRHNNALPPRPDGAAAGQISQVNAPNRNVDSGQISAPPRDSRAASQVQLAAPAHPAASTQIAAPSAGRNTQVSAIVGHDRCDPAAPTAKQPE